MQTLTVAEHPVFANDNSYNTVVNGDMELTKNGMPANWEEYDGVQLSDCTNIPNNSAGKYGSHAAELRGIDNAGMIQQVKNYVVGTTYTFSADVCPKNSKTEVYLQVYCHDANGNRLPGSISVSITSKISGLWKSVSDTISIPQNTAKLIILIRNLNAVDRKDKTTELVSLIDNVSLVGQLPAYARNALAFKEQLAYEKELNAPYLSEFPNGLYDKDEPYNGESDIILSENFQNGTGVFSNSFPGYAGWDSQNKCLYFNVPKDEVKDPYMSKNVQIEGGAEYQVSFRYKVLSGSVTEPVIKLEYSPREITDGIRGCGEKYIEHEPDTVRDGEWHEVTLKVYPPSNAASMNVLVRMLQDGTDNEAASQALIDDVEICRTYPSCFAVLDAGDIFYYSDKTQGKLQVKINEEYKSEADYSKARVDYKILDGEEKIFETQVKGTDLAVEFNLSLLLNHSESKGYGEGHTYRAVASVYKSDGVTVRASLVQNVYVYKRPRYIKNGIFYKNGERAIAPVYAYHVNEDHYDEVAEAGVNLVQMSADTPEKLIEKLDRAERYGIMGLICLYPDMKPAGHEDNLENTFKFVEAVMHHPAVFGYGVMDEVFSGVANPEKMLEASYRAIHMLDKNHPVCVMEAGRSNYEKAAKYVDVLLIDPYSASHKRNAAQSIALAKRVTDKPVYALLEAYRNGERYPTPDDGRNNNWQALVAGADAIGYYSISDSWYISSKESYPIWDAEHTGGHLWKALVSFNKYEKEAAQSHFVFKKGQKLFDRADFDTGKTIADTNLDYWYYAWQNGTDTYLVLLSFLDPNSEIKNQQITVSLPQKYAALLYAGRENQTIGIVNQSLTVNLSGSEALLYKLIPISENSDIKMVSTYYALNISKSREMIDFEITDIPDAETIITPPMPLEGEEIDIYLWDMKKIKPLVSAIKY